MIYPCLNKKGKKRYWQRTRIREELGGDKRRKIAEPLSILFQFF